MADIFQEEFHSPEEFNEVEDLVFVSKDSSELNEQDKPEQNGTEREDDDDDEEDFVNIHADSSSAEPQCSEPSLAELANSHFIHIRQTATKQLLDFITAARSNKDELLLAVSIMCKLADDEEPMVRAELMGQIPQIAKFCWVNGDDLKKVIRQQLVPITVKLINDEQTQVMKAAHSSLLALLEQKMIDEGQLSEWLCPLIAQLASSDTAHDQIASIHVMCKMASLVGKDLAIKFFLDTFTSLCDSSDHHVRKECLHNFIEFCKALGPVVTEVALLPKFLACCLVSSVSLRISCIEIFAELSLLVSPKSREILADYYLRVLDDDKLSEQVVDIAVRNLGIFITSFADPQKTGLCYDNGTWTVIPQNIEKLESDITNHQPQQNDTKVSVNHQVLDDSATNCDSESSEVASIHSQENSDWVLKQLRECVRRRNSKRSFGKVSDYSKDIVPDCHNFSNKQPTGLESLCCNSKEELGDVSPEKDTVFNNFQYWRLPLPEVNLELEDESKESNSSISSEVLDNIINFKTLKLKWNPSENGMPKSTFFCVEQSNLSSRDLIIPDGYKTFCDTTSNSEDDSEDDSKFNQDIVPPLLLRKYFEMLDSVDNSSSYENDVELAKCCAYSLLGVVYTLGRKFWPHLKPVVGFLSSHVQWSVRKTVASYLNKLAIIVGPNYAASDLMPVFIYLVKDLDEVRSSLLMNLAEFLGPLPVKEKREFLPYLEEFLKMDNVNNWRLRHALAQQIIPCVPLYEQSEVWEYFFPVASQLIRDRIAVVRREALLLMAAILKHLRAKEESHFPDLLLEEIKTLREAQKWHLRQTFVLVCEQMAANHALPREEYLEKIFPQLLNLAGDAVANIRMAVARCIQSTLIPKGYLSNIDQNSQNELYTKVLFSLKHDVDKDVRFFALLVDETST